METEAMPANPRRVHSVLSSHSLVAELKSVQQTGDKIEVHPTHLL